MHDFANRVVVISGGASGIGFAFAKRFGSEGAKIVIADINQSQLAAAEKALAALGITAAAQHCDMAEYQQVEALADFVWTKFGRGDVILNAAGIAGHRCPVLEQSRENIAKIFNTNFYGVWHGTKVFGRRFVEQGTPAAIYNIGSENSLYNFVPRNFAYQVSKHGVFAMTDALREEVPDFISVSLIIPGWVQTGMTKAATGGMDADEFVRIAMEQLKEGKFFVVSHAHNIVHIASRYQEIKEAYDRFAPRYPGDDEYDVPSLIEKMRAASTQDRTLRSGNGRSG